MHIYFQVGANTTFSVYKMFINSIAVPTCQYGATPAPVPTFSYSIRAEDGT